MKRCILFIIMIALTIGAYECTLVNSLSLIRLKLSSAIPKEITYPQGTKVQFLDHFHREKAPAPITVVYVDDEVRYYPDTNSVADLDFGSRTIEIDSDTLLTTKVLRGPRSIESLKPTLLKLDSAMMREYHSFWNHTIPHWKDKNAGQKRWRETLTGEIHTKLFINSKGEVIHLRTVSGRLRNSKCEGNVLIKIRQCAFPALAKESSITELHLKLLFDGSQSSLIVY